MDEVIVVFDLKTTFSLGEASREPDVTGPSLF